MNSNEELRSHECAQLEMIPSLLQNFWAANIASYCVHVVMLPTLSHWVK